MPNAPHSPTAMQTWWHNLRYGNSSRNAVFSLLAALLLAIAEFSSVQMRSQGSLAIGVSAALCLCCIASITGLRVRAASWRHRLGSVASALGGSAILLMGWLKLAQLHVVSSRLVEVHLLSLTTIAPLATCLLLAGGILQLPPKIMQLSIIPLSSSIALAAVIVRQAHLPNAQTWAALLAGVVIISTVFACWRLRGSEGSMAIKCLHSVVPVALIGMSLAVLVLGLLPQSSWLDIHSSGILTWGATFCAGVVFLSTFLPYPHHHKQVSTKQQRASDAPEQAQELPEPAVDVSDAANEAASTSSPTKSAAAATKKAPLNDAEPNATSLADVTAGHNRLADGTALYQAARKKVQRLNAQQQAQRKAG